jgi:triphosphoribosyl-dephospho-CoA synthase
MNLFHVFELAASRDSICSEWITNYQITFKVGYPYFTKELSRTRNLNEATVNTYLKILSQIPDTLIARKAGQQKSRYVSRRAKDALELGGVSSAAGLKAIHQLDEELRANKHILNPGSTADITAAVLSLALISGYKP